MVVLKNTVGSLKRLTLPAETVQSTASLLEGENDVKGSDGLPAAVLSVRDRVADQVLQEELEDRAGLLVDGAGNALHTTTASQAPNGGLKRKSRNRTWAIIM